MKKTVLILLLFPILTFSQVGIGNTTPNATLDITASSESSPSSTDGILIPRVNNLTATPLSAQNGMLVFLTTNSAFYFWNQTSTSWEKVNEQNGTTPGEMKYWDGSNWVTIPPGNTGQGLTFCYGVPTWGSCIPQVSTTVITSIFGSQATSGGNIVSDGGTTITAKGVCWSTTPTPTTADSFTSNGSGNGSYTSLINSLTQNTTYYVRAYATNLAGTAYGNEISFTTQNSTIPILTTTNITSLTDITAISGGTISNNGGAAITAKGVCWSSNPNPTIADNLSEDGIGSTAFVSNIILLNPSTTYYVRAYATNGNGTAYGNNIMFTTLVLQPIQIGDYRFGGVVFYIDGTGSHGLVCDITDQNYAEWGCHNVEITGADGTAIGTGNQNTIDIEAGCATPNTAADICANLSLNTYSDWFLPSRLELLEMAINKTSINSTSIIYGGTTFSNGYYWSSTEGAANYSILIYFLTNTPAGSAKNSTRSVRAVRAF